MLIRKSLKYTNTELILREDFTTIIKVTTNQTSVLISGVYLQPTSKKPDYKNIYQSQLGIISGILKNFEQTSEFIILGDFQCCPSSLPNQPSTRAGKSNQLTPRLDEFILRHNAYPIDLYEATGPTYTYQHTTLKNQSYIDHCIISTNLAGYVTNTTIIEQSYLNTGDHLPLTTNLELLISHENIKNSNRYHHQDEDFLPSFIWKNQRFIDQYSNIITNELSNYTLKDDLSESINDVHSILKKSALQAHSNLHKDHHFHFFKSKPWWNNELAAKKKTLQHFFNVWKADYFMKDTVAHSRYCYARKDFRKCVKKFQNQATTSHYVNVEKIKNYEPKKYWQQIRESRKGEQKLFTINNKTNVSEITEDFKDHFKSILNNPRVPDINNDDSNDNLQKLLEHIEKQEDEVFYVTEEDIRKASASLNNDKTYDPHDLKAEHFKYAPTKLHQTLATLTNRIMKSQELPYSLSTSIIIPLAKSYQKPLHDGNNYRGISLTPITTKIIEKTILNKCPNIKHHNNMQFGFSKNSSTIHAELFIKETIQKYNTEHTPIYLLSLDAEKAFDTCNWLKLFTHLYEKSIVPNTVLKFLIKLYIQGDASIRYRGEYSDNFTFSQGVRQGSILSPFFYNHYTEQLIKDIQDMEIGTKLPGGINTSIVAFADDIILLSPNLKQLQLMLDKCVDFGKEHGLKFNKLKTQFVISGTSPITDPTITLDNSTIRPQKELKHLGFKWGTLGKTLTLDRHIHSRLTDLWATTSSLISSGVRWVHPGTIATIAKSILIPKLLYGLELTELTKSFETLLNTQFRNSVKSLWGISKHSKNDLNKFYGIHEISSTIKARKLKLLQQLMKNDTTKHYLLNSLSTESTSPTLTHFMEICNEYGLNVIDVLLDKKLVIPNENDLNEGSKETIIDILTNWDYENQLKLKALLEANIIRH